MTGTAEGVQIPMPVVPSFPHDQVTLDANTLDAPIYGNKIQQLFIDSHPDA